MLQCAKRLLLCVLLLAHDVAERKWLFPTCEDSVSGLASTSICSGTAKVCGDSVLRCLQSRRREMLSKCHMSNTQTGIVDVPVAMQHLFGSGTVVAGRVR